MMRWKGRSVVQEASRLIAVAVQCEVDAGYLQDECAAKACTIPQVSVCHAQRESIDCGHDVALMEPR